MIRFSAAAGVGLVELDRPERRNALDVEHCRGLTDAVATRWPAGFGRSS